MITRTWTIQYWVDGKNSVERWLDQLTYEQLKSVAKEIKLLELGGNSLKLPHSRSLGSGLFELRERRYGYRVYYGFCGKQIILLLAAGDKTTQARDITIARQRLAQLTKIKGSYK